MNLRVNIHDPYVATKFERLSADGPLHLRIVARDKVGRPTAEVEIIIYNTDDELFLGGLEEAISKFRAECLKLSEVEEDKE